MQSRAPSSGPRVPWHPEVRRRSDLWKVVVHAFLNTLLAHKRGMRSGNRRGDACPTVSRWFCPGHPCCRMIPHTVGTLFLFVNLVFAVAWECAPLLAKSAFIGTNVESHLRFLGFRVLSMIQFDLTDFRGSCVTSTYSVEDGPKPVI